MYEYVCIYVYFRQQACAATFHYYTSFIKFKPKEYLCYLEEPAKPELVVGTNYELGTETLRCGR